MSEDEHRHCLGKEGSEGVVLHGHHLDVNSAEDFCYLTEEDKKTCSVHPFPVLLQSPDTAMQMTPVPLAISLDAALNVTPAVCRECPMRAESTPTFPTDTAASV